MIIFDVNISEYKDMIAEKLGMCHATYNVGVQESGEATANDLIATIRNKITQLYKWKVTTHDKKKGLAMKFVGYSDYLLGHYRLKDYRRINKEFGKDLVVIKIMLTEIPVDQKDKNFPPLYFLRPGFEFDFKKLESSSLMFLYPPKKDTLAVEPLNEMPQLISLNENDELETQKIPEYFYTNRKHKYFKARSSILNKKRNRIENELKTSDMRSPFRFKIVGFERLHALFDCLFYNDTVKMDQEMGRNNFMLQPEFINPLKSPEDIIMHDVPSRSILRQCLENLDAEMEDFSSLYNNFGCNFKLNDTLRMLEFEEKNYVPVQLYLKCHLYLGSELLSPSVYTKNIYFSNSAQVNEWIQFYMIRYCDLPRNAKICIDIILETMEPKWKKVDMKRKLSYYAPKESKPEDLKKMYTKGIDLHIGCISFNVFDHLGKFKNIDKGFNVWPFYAHDPLLGCMKEYHGVSSKIFHAKNKRRDEWHWNVYLEFEQFTRPVVFEMKTIEKFNEERLGAHIGSDNTYTQRRSKAVSIKDKQLIDELILKKGSPGEFLVLRELIARNPFQALTPYEKSIMFKNRLKLTKVSKSLPLFLKSI
jgi:hypothetical protein